MSKRKSNNDLVRFVWKRNPDYDLFLLMEVESRNPYSFVKPKTVWQNIAKALQESILKMKVTDRSCRERVGDLLKTHRKDEKHSIESTGGNEEGMTMLKKLLTSVSQMEQTKPDKKDSSLYSKENKRAESVRAAALICLSDSDSDSFDEQKYKDLYERDYDSLTLEEETLLVKMICAKSNKSTAEQSRAAQSTAERSRAEQSTAERSRAAQSTAERSRAEQSTAEQSTAEQSTAEQSTAEQSTAEQSTAEQSRPEQLRPEQSNSTIEQPTTSRNFGANLVSQRPIMHHESIRDESEAMKDEHLSSDRFSNPKKDLVAFLHKKAQGEKELRKEEIDIRKEEVRIREVEANNKKEELNILRLKTEAEAEERKKMYELMVQLINRNVNQ